MSAYLSLNLSEYSLKDDIKETIKTSLLFCICCLKSNSDLIRLENCVHGSYLDCFMKPEISISDQLVCQQCHTILRKIETFRQQVEESFTLLCTQPHLTTDHLKVSTYSKLVATKPTLMEIETFEDGIKNIDISEPIVTIHEDLESSRLFNNINKIKVEGLPLNEEKVKDVVESSPVLPKKRRRHTKEPMYKRFKGKIRKVILSRDEMIQERTREAESQCYLKLPYRCERCIVGFDHELNYDDHMRKKHEKREGNMLTCDICESVLNSSCSYKKHVSNHYTRYDCEECGKRYNGLSSVMQHYITEHGPIGVTYSCQQCDFTSNLKSALVYHRNKHRSNQCPECGKHCSSGTNLKTHLFSVHKHSNRKYTCADCNKAYNTKSGLDHHNLTTHSTEKSTIYCALCDVHYNSQRCYLAHLRLSSKHVGEDAKKHVCEECGAKFMTGACRKRHVEVVHLKLTKYGCGKCHESFKTRYQLRRHDDKVHEKKPAAKDNICQYCGKGYSMAKTLRIHIRSHTGERPLQCTHCAATFAHNAALYKHRKVVHRDIIENKG